MWQYTSNKQEDNTHQKPLSAPSLLCKANNRQRDIAIDALRGVAIMLVVVGHAVQYSIQQGFEQNILFRAIYSFHMPLFFLISGYLLGEPQCFREVWPKIKSRMLSLLVPYVFWVLFWYGLYTLSGGTIGKSMAGHPIWFLPVLFACFCVHTIVVLMSWWHGTMMKVAVGMCVVLIMHAVGPTTFWLSSVRYHYVFLLIGTVIQGRHSWAGFQSLKTLAVCAVLWACLLPGWQFSSRPEWVHVLTNNTHLQVSVYLAFRIVVALLAACGLYSLVVLMPRSVRHCLARLGFYSIHIYVIHIGFLEATYPHCVLFRGWFWVCTAAMVAIPIVVAEVAGRNPYIAMLAFGRRIS
jgi:fucose 4-O-acetylase-like acetyltransferase